MFLVGDGKHGFAGGAMDSEGTFRVGQAVIYLDEVGRIERIDQDDGVIRCRVRLLKTGWLVSVRACDLRSASDRNPPKGHPQQAA
jgi:hypothetical protein